MTELIRSNAPQFTINIEGYDDKPDSVLPVFYVMSFWGEESISQPFLFTIQLESSDQNIIPDDVVGKKAKFTISSQGSIRNIHGIISRFEFSGIERNNGIYNVDLSPELFLLSQKQQSRIFQNKDAQQILQEVLETSNLDAKSYEFVQISGKYEKHEFCVQYNESDLNFLNRIAEQHGIFYFFQYEENATKLIIADSKNAHPDIVGAETDGPPEIMYYQPRAGQNQDNDFIQEFRISHTMRPSKYVVKDYSYYTPSESLMDNSKNKNLSYDLECFEYPGRFQTSAAAVETARIRMEEEDCDRYDGQGISNSVRLVPGCIFKLTHHIERLTKDIQYLNIGVVHSGSQPVPDGSEADSYGYSNDFQFIDSKIPFRPARLTPKPLITSSQTATVSGPQGHEIYSHEYSRIKVKFHWDRKDTSGDQRSCWIRVVQPWSGKGWGAVCIPRIGQEVLVSFLDGDPDKPIITGTVYNNNNKTPYNLPDKQTVTTLKSNSSMGGDGFNELRFEDLKDSEEIFIHAQKDFTLATNNCKNQTVGNNETLEVGNNRMKTIKKDETIVIEGNRIKTVHLDENVNIKQNRKVEIDNGDDKLEVKSGDLIIEVNSGDEKRTIKTGDRIVDINTGNDKLTVKTGDHIVDVNKGDEKLTVKTGDRKIKVNAGDNSVEVGSGSHELKVKKEIKMESKKASLSTDEETELKTGGSSIKMSDKKIEMNADQIFLKGTKAVQLKVGGNNVSVGSSGIVIKCAGRLVLKGSIVQIN